MSTEAACSGSALNNSENFNMLPTPGQSWHITYSSKQAWAQPLRECENKQQQAVLADYEQLLQVARHYDQQQQQRFKQQAQEIIAQGQPAPEPETLDERLKGFLEYLNLLILLRQDAQAAREARMRKKRALIVFAL